MFFFVVCCNYVSHHCDHYYYHPTCDSCVFWIIADNYDFYYGSNLCGPNNISSAWCGSAITDDSEWHVEGLCWPCHFPRATTTSVPDAFSAICQLRHGSSVGGVSFSELSFLPIHVSYIGVSYGVYLLSSGSHVAAMFTVGVQPLGFATLLTFGVHIWQVYIPTGDGPRPMPGVHQVAATPPASSGASFMDLFKLLHSHSIWWGIQLGGSAASHPIPLHSLHDGDGSSFPSSDMVDSESMMVVKCSDSVVVIRYQVNEFTHIWLVEGFIA